MTQKPGAFTLAEIQSQPDTWLASLQVIASAQSEIETVFKFAAADEVLFTGCGSTYYLSMAAAAHLTEIAGIPARGVPASELWLYPKSAYPAGKRYLLVAVSRSGETTETIRACEAFLKDQRGTLVTVSCFPGRPLTTMGTLNLVFPAAMEESIAQTRAFSTLYLACVALNLLWSGKQAAFEQLPQLAATGRRVIEQSAPLAYTLANDPAIDRFYFLGSGSRYPLAAELSLKMKEMSLSHSEPFHFMEFRHGPKSMVSSNTLVIGLLSESNYSAEAKVLAEMQEMGAQILSIGEKDARVSFHGGLPEALQNILYLPVGQQLAFERSVGKGLDPDRPTNLSAVVHLD